MNPCTCKAEHWQPHADSCPQAKPNKRAVVREYVSFQAQLEGVTAMGSAASHLVLQSLVAQAARVVERLVLDKEQLRGNLSLAEEGLANYALEVERHRATLLQVKQARLDWAMVCECTCAACETFSNVIRLIGRSAVEPTSHEPRSYCPNCDCDYCSSAERLRERGSHEPSEQHSSKSFIEGYINAADHLLIMGQTEVFETARKYRDEMKSGDGL